MIPSVRVQAFHDNLEHLKQKSAYDAAIILFSCPDALGESGYLKTLCLDDYLQEYVTSDNKVFEQVSFLMLPQALRSKSSYPLPSRVVLAPTGPLHRDQDDVRRFGDAARAAIKRAKAAGCQKLLFVFLDVERVIGVSAYKEIYAFAVPSTILAVYAELYEPLQARESLGDQIESVAEVTYCAADEQIQHLKQLFSLKKEGGKDNEELCTLLNAIEEGRRLAKDVGDGDPERMTPMQCGSFIEKYFRESKAVVGVSLITKHDALKCDYPLLWAVARASLPVERHHPCVVHLEYKSPKPAEVCEELFLVGKGICYDTGGADLKVGGNMVGMSRDKCGAAAIAGFFAILKFLKPLHLNVTADLAFVRNSIGSAAYVSDEIIRSRAGVRVRVGNTDAEGRMVMTDLLAHMKERALCLKDPSKARLMTCATLTGHVGRAFGPYAMAMDNGPAQRSGIAQSIFDVGYLLGDAFETSRLRREDYSFVAPMNNREDVIQANSLPSTLTARGHQYPMAFMIIASGLMPFGSVHASMLIGDKPGDIACADKATSKDVKESARLCYTHVDIASSAEESFPLGKVTGSPLVSLAFRFIHNVKRI